PWHKLKWEANGRREVSCLQFVKVTTRDCIGPWETKINSTVGWGFFDATAGLQQVEAAAADSEMANLNWKPFIYGGMASIVAEFGTFPIDLTKTRLQVQGQSQYTEVRYRGMFHALFRIGKEEGIRALYSGYAA
ncbi:hypothetical protein ATANTOWER_008016, partial [Ataeniobius toweri]|nr:hypothetical protein [Ataeniobius toweri]